MELTQLESLYPATSRDVEVSKIISFIRGGNSCQVVSLPGVGRSNLLRLLSFNRNVRIRHFGQDQKWYHFVYVNFSEIRRRPLVEAIKFLFLELTDSLRERQMDDVYTQAQAIFKESLSLNDELVLFQGLKRAIDLLAVDQKYTIVFLFDRFEEYVPMLTNDFFANLRVLRNRSKYHFSVIFSLNRPLEDLVEPELFADFHEFLAGHTIYLPLYDPPGMEFRVSYLEKTTGKKVDNKLLEKVLELTGGHGKLTRLSLEALLSTPQKSPPFEGGEGVVEFLLSQKPVRGALFEIWRSLTPSEQKSLLPSSRTLRQDFDGELRRTAQGKLEPRDLAQTPSSNLRYLEAIGLIKQDQITIPLFATFIEKEFAAQALEADRLTYDPNSHAINKGNLTISDGLTSAEYRMLRFFITNPDRIIERDEVINAVWQENKSTAGVTDQAVDQLVFRLRKKIEDDPNNPKHLQTIKGRGFRFVPVLPNRKMIP